MVNPYHCLQPMANILQSQITGMIPLKCLINLEGKIIARFGKRRSRMENSIGHITWSAIVHRGHPTTIFGNICSEDDLRSRIFGSFVVKFLACLPLQGFSNI